VSRAVLELVMHGMACRPSQPGPQQCSNSQTVNQRRQTTQAHSMELFVALYMYIIGGPRRSSLHPLSHWLTVKVYCGL